MPERHKKSVRSTGRRGGRGNRRADAGATSVLRILREVGEPLTWPALRDRVGATRDADGLSRVLRDLCRSGELFLDEDGAYHVVATGESVTGTLEAEPDRPGRLRLRVGHASDGDRNWPVRVVGRHALRGGDRVSARIIAEQAVVIEVLEHSTEPVIGRLVEEHRGAYVVPDTPGFRSPIYLRSDDYDAAEGDTVAVRIAGDEPYGMTGDVVAVVARRDDIDVASSTLLRAYRVPVAWPEAALAAAGALPDSVDRRSASGRTDLRELPLVTIDGEDARDFDDAVFCEPRRRGGWRLVVAIADVAHYVAPNSPLDVEAAERGNSVYLPDRVVPMLPEALSNELCSLKPRVDRLCMVCDMQLSGQGRITGFTFYEGILHSAARLTYTQVADFLDGGRLDVAPAVRQSLQALHDAYRALLVEREARGALDFDTRELKLVLENGLLERIEPVARNDAHRLIEEAMISANVCAARFIEKHERQALYRIHEGPTGDKLENLRQALALIGIRLGSEQPTPKALQAIIAGLGERKDKWLYEMLVLRSMSQAAYHPTNIGHFGLALPRYMHFTSPIRRYADLVVHRAIKDALHDRPHQDRVPRLLAIGEHISFTDRRAEEVSRAVADWLKCEYANRYVGERFDAQIIGVTDFGLFAELDGIFVQGLIHISNLGDDFYEFQPGTMSLLGERSRRRFQLGDTVDVVLAAVNLESRKVDLLLAPDAPAPESRRRRRGRR